MRRHPPRCRVDPAQGAPVRGHTSLPLESKTIKLGLVGTGFGAERQIDGRTGEARPVPSTRASIPTQPASCARPDAPRPPASVFKKLVGAAPVVPRRRRWRVAPRNPRPRPGSAGSWFSIWVVSIRRKVSKSELSAAAALLDALACVGTLDCAAPSCAALVCVVTSMTFDSLQSDVHAAIGRPDAGHVDGPGKTTGASSHQSGRFGPPSRPRRLFTRFLGLAAEREIQISEPLFAQDRRRKDRCCGE